MNLKIEQINSEIFNVNELQEIAEEIFISQADNFEKIKNQKWYSKLLHAFVFRNAVNQKIKFRNVDTLADIQQLFLKLYAASEANHSQSISGLLEKLDSLADHSIKLHDYCINGIRHRIDIADLSADEKCIFISILENLLDPDKLDTNQKEARKEYNSSIKKFLGILTAYDYSTKTIENFEHPEALYRCAIELMYYVFHKENKSALNNDILSYLVLSDNQKSAIEKDVKKETENYEWAQLCKKYESVDAEFEIQSDDYEEISDSFTVDFENPVETSIKDEDNMEMKDEIISSIIHIRPGETKTYKNRSLHIQSFINCEGNLEIDHCILYYNETNSYSITLAEGTNLSIKNSVIIGKGFDENSLFLCEGDNNIHIETTTFIDCSHFIHSQESCSFSMRNCEIVNCYDGFVSICIGEEYSCDISDNIITQDGLSDFFIENLIYSPTLIHISLNSGNNVYFHNNMIIEKLTFKKAGVTNKKSFNTLCYFDGYTAVVSNCTFIGISSAITALQIIDCKFEDCLEAIHTTWSNYSNPIIDNCIFKHSTNIVQAYEGTKITNCQFVSCYNQFIFASDFGGVDIEYCEFINTKFLDPKDYVCACIRFGRMKGSYGRENHIKKCIFNGVELANQFLIAAYDLFSEKPSGPIAYIEDCIFENCSTERSSGKIIKEYIQYDTIFKTNQDYHANYIVNCKGLEYINKKGCEAENIEERTISTNGNPIGSAIAMSVAAATIGGPMGLLAATGVYMISKSINKRK